MYDELIKRLRCQRFGNCPNCPMWYTEEVEPNLWRERCAAIDAADAIEELSKIREEQKAQIILMAAEDKPRWIPVTERLPEDDKAVLAHVYWPEYGDTMICYGHWHKGWFHLFHHVEGELISGYVVTHWMPLPQPPKEE